MGVIDTAKDIYDLVKKGATIELQEKINQFREEAINLQSENIKLKERIKDLEDQLNIRENLIFEGSVYWLETPETKKDGPYCQKCYNVDKNLVRLRRIEFKGKATFRCLQCKSRYPT